MEDAELSGLQALAEYIFTTCLNIQSNIFPYFIILTKISMHQGKELEEKT